MNVSQTRYLPTNFFTSVLIYWSLNTCLHQRISADVICQHWETKERNYKYLKLSIFSSHGPAESDLSALSPYASCRHQLRSVATPASFRPSSLATIPCYQQPRLHLQRWVYQCDQVKHDDDRRLLQQQQPATPGEPDHGTENDLQPPSSYTFTDKPTIWWSVALSVEATVSLKII